ncbi:polyprenyl synthetase family protein [Desulfallas thermosapovorans]|uniref:Farnesyl diphosphate synthase n=1 Tax=Desulfallas thermosapovorans DSM 6562 TaxID=1121431 RepID=A0A5S4ZU55_9FIRM|nr:farnesyl diphosphate synthase [Desulfallas thermosapovorans]TYO95620.1 geranylgeranyl diphosphate synthase type II [Desulfallas thermosapovorans DSM 6562]
MAFKEELAGYAAMVDKALDEYLPSASNYPSLIHEAMRYSVFAGGKRLRPALVLASARAVGGGYQFVLPAACAIELLHTYSLVHDDLPAMDNDDLRRGRPTSHKIYGEAMAVLVGDALLTLAFEILAGLSRSGSVDTGRILRVIHEVAVAAGTMGLIGGQVVDILSSDKLIDRQVLDYIHSRKTGALYKASVRAGAMLSGATPEQLDKLTLYAENLGLAFQIVDDILDIEGDEQKLGKPVGSDTKNQKATYPALYGLAAAKDMARQAAEHATGALASFGAEAGFLRGLVGFVLNREN